MNISPTKYEGFQAHLHKMLKIPGHDKIGGGSGPILTHVHIFYTFSGDLPLALICPLIYFTVVSWIDWFGGVCWVVVCGSRNINALGDDRKTDYL